MQTRDPRGHKEGRFGGNVHLGKANSLGRGPSVLASWINEDFAFRKQKLACRATQRRARRVRQARRWNALALRALWACLPGNKNTQNKRTGISKRASSSATGTRTRVARVGAEYPSQLDYSGICVSKKCMPGHPLTGNSFRN